MARDTQLIYTGLFNDSFYPVRDGVAVAVENYAQWLPEHGMQPLVVTPWNRPRPAVPYPLIRYMSIPVVGRKPYRFGLPWLDPTVWHRLRRTQFNIVHAHSPFSSGKLAQYVSHKHNVPLIATFHSKFKADMQRSFHGRERIVNHIIRRVIEFFDSCDEVWIPQSEVEETIREYGYKGELSVMPNGNDLCGRIQGDMQMFRAEARNRLGMPQRRLQILFVGQHILEKGLPLIVDTLVCMQKRGVEYEMNFIGTGYARDWLSDRIAENNLTDSVHLRGPIHDRKTLADYYAASDLLFFPSPYDNAPLVVREAAAMGTPTILLQGSTASSIAEDGVTAFLCSDKAEDVAAMISALSEDRAKMQRVGECASSSLNRPWQDIINEVADKYRHAIARHRRR